MRIIIITQGLSRVVQPLISSEHEIVGIIDNLQRKDQRKQPHILSLISFIWSKLSNRTTLKSFCKYKNIKYLMMRKSNDIGLFEWINSLRPDLIVVFSMSTLLTKTIFSIPRFGTINLHPSFLPDYRGPNPCFWHYYDVELNPGVTVHYISEGEDLGDIIYQERINIELGIKSKDRLDRLINELGVYLLIKAINDIEKGVAPRIPQLFKSKTVRARNIKESEHSSLVNWEEFEGTKIWHILRGAEDWLNVIPQPNGMFKNTRWLIGNFEKMDSSKFNIGHIYNIDGEFKLITKDGFINLNKRFSFSTLIKNILCYDFK
jgi:methionyl-tRNA formyltransferase